MNRIKEVLKAKGVKQTWLAKKLGKSYNMVNSYVQNRRQPSLHDLFRIAEILEVDPDSLLDKNLVRKITKFDEEEVNTYESKDTANNAQTEEIPLLGSIACGSPLLAEENIEAQIPVSTELIKPSYNYFLLKAVGDSMDQCGINDGDLVLIRQQQIADNGDIVVALIDDEATIKQYFNKGSTIVLRPQSTNTIHQPIILNHDFHIQGIVETVVRI